MSYDFRKIKSFHILITFIGKFKSGVQINSAAMSVQELMELLNSRDHNGIWRGNVSTTGQGKIMITTIKSILCNSNVVIEQMISICFYVSWNRNVITIEFVFF